MIVVATSDFELYHDLVRELRTRDVAFTTVEPDDSLPGGTTAIITGRDERVVEAEDLPVLVATPSTTRRAVERALSHGRGGSGRTIVGVDPGERPGIAVLEGDLVVAAVQVPLDEAVAVIESEVAGEPDAVVRIGHGARLKGARIINDLEDVRIELVDETGTTPSLGQGARGMGDLLAAVNIARLEGEPVVDRQVEPTAGELAAIQHRSREVSPVNRAIDESLAERVARGELSIEEALDRHSEHD